MILLLFRYEKMTSEMQHKQALFVVVVVGLLGDDYQGGSSTTPLKKCFVVADADSESAMIESAMPVPKRDFPDTTPSMGEAQNQRPGG